MSEIFNQKNEDDFELKQKKYISYTHPYSYRKYVIMLIFLSNALPYPFDLIKLSHKAYIMFRV